MFYTCQQSNAMLSTCHQSLTMLSTCRFRSPQGRWLKSHSFATLNANLERLPAFVATCSSHAIVHPCISPWAKCFALKSVGSSHPGTLAMVSSRRATASSTHTHSSHSAPRGYRLRRRGTWLDHLGHICSHGHCA